jgi:capsular exopolysaccharide synthesis family protein
MLPSSKIRDVTIKDYLVIIKRRALVILACFLIVTARATLKTLKKVPIYQANAKLFIERTLPEIAPFSQVYAPSWVDREYIQSQISILTSRSLAKKTVEHLIAAGDTTFVGTSQPEDSFLGGVQVSEATGTSILNVGYVSTDPINAAKFANALADTFIQEDVARRAEVSKYAVGWLDIQLTELQKRLGDSEAALSEYIKANEIVSVVDIERNTNALLDDLKHQKITIENELVELSGQYKSKHPKIVALNTRLEAVNKSIDNETKKLIEVNQKMIRYNALKREVDSNKSLYESLLKKIKETEVSKELLTTNIRILDLATVPGGPFSPNRKQDILQGVMLGLFLGAGLAFLLEYLDSTVKTADDIETYVRLPFLGYVPSVAEGEAKTEKEIDLISQNVPRSRISEAYRSIRTSIMFSVSEDRPLKTILVTSASPLEGKTTVGINLGIVFAQSNEKVLLIEADMRKPRICNSLDLDNKVGLSSFLTGTEDLETSIRQTNIANLSILSSGPRPPNPAELLTSTKTRTFLEELKTRFDRIIIDSPPLLTVADTSILANIVDGVIYVIRAGALNIDMILRGKQRLSEVKSRVIGVILNNVNVKKDDSYYYYHYYYAEEKENKT